MSVTFLRDRAAQILAWFEKEKAVEALIAFLLTDLPSEETVEILNELTCAEIKVDPSDGDGIIDAWVEWWSKNRMPRFQGLDLKSLAPRMAAALEARTMSAGFDQFNAMDCSFVRLNLATNPFVPEGILLALASDSVTEVRRVLAKRKHLPNSVAQVLAVDTQDVVRRFLAWNDSADRAILELLKNDMVAGIRETAATRLASQQKQV
jgi:hypothetical protein